MFGPMGPLEHTALRLDNGLRVVLVPRAPAPLATVWVRYGVGAGDDPPEHRGLAHLVEHLLFTGSRHTYGSDTSDHLYQARALGANGATAAATTDYYQSVPRVNLERVLWLESDRMGYMRGEVTRAEVDLARQVVDTELKIINNDPQARMFGRVHNAVFPAPHPFHDPEDASTLARVDVAAVERFLARYVVPANAILIVVGDLPNDIEELVRRYFAGLPGGTAPVRPAVPASPLTTAALMREAAEAAIVKIGWPSPVHRTRGDAAADLAAVLLEHNLGGRLWAEDGAIAALEAQQVSKAGSSLFVVQAVGRPGTPAREVLRAVEAALANLAGVSAEEVAAARAVMRVEAMGRRGSTMALAETIAAHMTAYGKADALADELQRYHSTGVEDVVALARDTLVTSRRAVLLADAEGGRA